MYFNCDICGGQTEILLGQTYHYKESGLDNVYLENIEVRVCKQCNEKSPVIPRIMQVHKLMALAVALSDTPLIGAETRFLRTELGYKVKDWAKLLKISESTVVRWESSSQAIGAQSDALMRLCFIQTIQERDSHLFAESVIKRIAAIKEGQKPNIYINTSDPTSYRYFKAA